MQLQQGNESFRDTGNQLKIAPGLKSEILEKLAEEIFLYTAYPQNYQIDDVAGALIKKFPCLKEQSATGYYSWMISLKYKMANYRTKMRIIGCPEVTVNALKNKSSDECLPAKNVKKPKKAEVNFFPSHPAGETDESLEKVRLELLVDIRQRNTASRVREKMSKTFSYRRKEVVQEKPTAGEVKTRWPALFHISELNAEFQRITTLPLETTFMAQLDKHLPQLKSVFQKKGAQVGQKLAQHLEVLQEETSDINLRREAVLKGLCIYLGEDDAHLIKEYMDIEGDDILKDIKKSPMGIYVINKEGGRPRHFDDIGIHVEREILLDNIGSEAQACAMMLGVIYALNMTYPKELRYYYEFIQKVQEKLNSASRNKPIFEGLLREMAAAGYTRTVDQLLNKLKKLKKDSRDQKRELGCSGSGRDVSPHLEMLNAVLGDRPANTSSGALCSAVLEETATEPDVSSVHMECSTPWAESPGLSCSSPQRSCSTPLPSPSASSSIALSAAAMGKRKRDSIGEVLQYMEKSDEVFLLEGREDRQLSKVILESLTNMDAHGANMIAPDGGAGEEEMCFSP
ncbi:uncharacterized protein LOC114460738 [Gouania willdenowi]|uniref:uncharacterized protein LOC114460738 n=1 Tax=Gouania willdenowi TaxID=441366 RepID=UPI0010562B8B|nr:uncharacterized protein LOC114460738 [Gouania willdenowi]